MDRRHRDILYLVTIIVCALGETPHHSLKGAQVPSASAAPHSVLLITIDTVRADHLGCYGYRRIETPVIDQLASEGIRFKHAYAQVPLTLPSHTVIMTGTYPMFNGVRDLTSPGLNKTLPTLAEILRKDGYSTAAFVSSFVLNSMWGLNRGFDVYDDETGAGAGAASDPSLLKRRGDQTVDRALAWLDSHSGRPFFLWVHLYDPHSPYRPPEPYLSRYAGRTYDGEIAFDDAQLGRLFARLRQLKLYENALIVLTSDHGESLGEHGEAEHGFFIYDSTIHVPLVVKLSGPSSGPRTVAEPIELVDVAPTIADLCRVPRQLTRSFQGHALAGIQGAGATSPAAPAYAESYYPRNTFGWHELRGLITSQYQFIDAPRPELYNLERDPGETHDLAASQSAFASALREKLQNFEGRYTNASLPQKSNGLDSETLEKLRSLGYVGYQAPGTGGNSSVARADPKDKVQVLNQMLRAGNLRSEQHYAESEKILTDLERSDPQLYILGFEHGETLLDWGKAQESIAEFHKALTLNPSFDEAWMGMGRAAFVLGKNKDAVEALNLALRLNPRNYEARRWLARAYWREDEPEEAERELAQVASEHPDFAEGRAEHGVALARIKKYREAIAELQAASSLGDHDSVLYYYLGISYGETGDATHAIKAYQKAVEVDPNYAAAYMRLALQYRQRGDQARAHSYFRKTCTLNEQLCHEYAAQF
ncbi:MAG TPA: sulfatase-like hydrolase/transferase [Terriglobia bacterium]|nr:sulfatase-like hydrolase/transferase [Terriglobia bacterium]